MDAVSLANSDHLMGHHSVVSTDSLSPNSHSFFNGIHSSKIASLSSLPKTITSLQDTTAGKDVFRGDRSKPIYEQKGSDVIRGISRQANVLFGHNGNDQIWGGKKNDVLNGGSERDTLIGDRGNDFLVGGSESDRLLGGQGNDTLRGESGIDWLTGDTGDDDLDGGAGIDRLNGGNGNDRLMDYDGGDRLTGGSGADQFGVGSPLTTKASIVTDFKRGIDQLKVLRLGAAFKDLTFQEHRDGTLVLDQGQAIALLVGVGANRLKADSFIFGTAQLADTLQKTLNQALTQNPQATGLSATVFAPDGTLWRGFAGVSDRKTQTPIDADSLFGIGSITKPIVATAVLQLQEEGKLNLNDTLSQWLPELSSIPNSDRITVRQLLGHTSGIRDYTSEPDLIKRFFDDPSALSQSYTSEELLSYIKGKPALSEPGREFLYSNSNYLLLGEIIEKVTGSTLASQLQQRIFKPLGMEHTFFAPQEEISKGGLTHSYEDLNADGQLDDLNENLSWTSAAGGIVSTAADIAEFSQALFQGELLAPATLQRMIKDSSDIEIFGNLKSHQYGLGVESGSVPKIGEFWGHDGATVGWQSDLAYLPDRQISAIGLATASETSSEDFAIKITLENLQNTVQSYPLK